MFNYSEKNGLINSSLPLSSLLYYTHLKYEDIHFHLESFASTYLEEKPATTS